jgi:polyadenylate-binding protein
MRYDELAALSPVVRKEVLTGELSRRVKSMGTVVPEEVDAIVDSIVGLSLGEVIQGIQDPGKLVEQVQTVKQTLYPPPPPKDSPDKSPSPATSHDSRLLDPNALNATASAPEHPSTPISVSEHLLNTPPRTSSPSGSLPPTSEKERMQAAVSKLESTRQGELTDLLMSLPKRERALCLFNVEILRAKLADAKMVLDSDDVEEAEATPLPPLVPPNSTKTEGADPSSSSPPPPPPPAAAPSASSSSTHTLASLAKLPAVEIIQLVNSPSTTGLPLPKPDPLVVKATDEFIDSLLNKSVPAQKQALGDKLCGFLVHFFFSSAQFLFFFEN